MANSLLQKMSRQVVGSQMQNNPVMNMFNALRSNGNNPQFIIDMISKHNPQMGMQMKNMLSNGQNPQQIVNSILQSKSPMEIENIKNTMEGLGLPKNISNQVFGNINTK